MLSRNEKIYISLLIFLLLFSSIILLYSYRNRKESYVELIKNPKLHIIYFSGDLLTENDKDIKIPQDFTEKIEKIIHKHKNELSNCTIHKFNPLLSSTDINQDKWNNLGKYIANLYDSYDAFLIIHGNDTITYTSSALYYMFENLKKPIVLTNLNNLYVALKYATISKLPFVVIASNGSIIRGDKATNDCKESEIISFNYPKIATIENNEILINYKNNIKNISNQSTTLKTLNPNINICIFKLYPNIYGKYLKESILNMKCNALILQLYGNGNTQTDKEFLLSLRELNDSGILIVAHTNSINSNISDDMLKCGIILIKNITLESLYSKLLYTLSYMSDIKEIRNDLNNINSLLI